MDHSRPVEGHLSPPSLSGAGKPGLGPRAEAESAVHSLRGGGVADLPRMLGTLPHLHARLHSVLNQRHQVELHHSHRAVVHWDRKHGGGAAGARPS